MKSKATVAHIKQTPGGTRQSKVDKSQLTKVNVHDEILLSII